MNTLTAFALTMALSLGGASTAFASNMNGQVPQTKDLSAQEMSSAVGAGQIYWRTVAPQTRLFQSDGSHAPHRATASRSYPSWFLISTHRRHHIQVGQPVQVWCQGYTMRSARFKMPRGNVGLNCR